MGACGSTSSSERVDSEVSATRHVDTERKDAEDKENRRQPGTPNSTDEKNKTANAAGSDSENLAHQGTKQGTPSTDSHVDKPKPGQTGHSDDDPGGQVEKATPSSSSTTVSSHTADSEASAATATAAAASRDGKAPSEQQASTGGGVQNVDDATQARDNKNTGSADRPGKKEQNVPDAAAAAAAGGAIEVAAEPLPKKDKKKRRKRDKKDKHRSRHREGRAKASETTKPNDVSGTSSNRSGAPGVEEEDEETASSSTSTASSGASDKQTNASSWDDSDDEDDDAATKYNRNKAIDLSKVRLLPKEDISAIKGFGGTKCRIGGAGLNGKLTHRLKCARCGYRVYRFPHCRWADDVDYFWVRNYALDDRAPAKVRCQSQQRDVMFEHFKRNESKMQLCCGLFVAALKLFVVCLLCLRR